MRDISPKLKSLLPFRGQFVLAEIEEHPSNAQDRLNEGEKKELASLTNDRRKREYIASRLALKNLVRKLGINPGGFTIFKDELGQPYGSGNSKEYFVSIAHTRQMVFCGITEDQPIGVDLEPADRKVPPKLKTRILHPDEALYFSEMPAIRLWTIKEAYIKLRGQGLRLNMNQVQVQQSGEEFLVELNNDKSAKICSFQLRNNWLAIAYYQN